MTASFPGSVKVFGADRIDGDYILAADVNDLRAEVGAIEAWLLGGKRLAVGFSRASDASLALAPGLSVNVVAGRAYRFTAVLHTTSAASGGIKAAIGGTCAAGSFLAEGLNIAVTISQLRTTTLGSPVAALTATTSALVLVVGSLAVSGSGTLAVLFGQNASSASPSVLLAGSTFVVEDVG